MRLGCPIALLVPLLAGAFLLFAGCQVKSRYQLTSAHTDAVLTTELPLTAYVQTNAGGADIYLTNLRRADLDPDSLLPDVRGHIVHIQIFLFPRIGKSPVGDTASNATIRHIIVSGGEIGLFGGGGFVFPKGALGDRVLGGTIDGGTIKPLEMTPGFRDKLGSATLSAGFRAELDPATARALALKFDALTTMIRERQPAPDQ